MRKMFKMVYKYKNNEKLFPMLYNKIIGKVVYYLIMIFQCVPEKNMNVMIMLNFC